MSGIKKVLTMSAVILLIMAVLVGCPMLLKDSTIKNGQYIELNIGSDSAAKAITVTEYDVTKLEIEIYDPQGMLIDDFSWYPDEGQQSYLIPVTGEGEYELVVTHISDENGTVIEAEESAFFNIEAMVITAINIVPGLIGMIDINPGGVEDELLTISGRLLFPEPDGMIADPIGSDGTAWVSVFSSDIYNPEHWVEFTVPHGVTEFEYVIDGVTPGTYCIMAIIFVDDDPSSYTPAWMGIYGDIDDPITEPPNAIVAPGNTTFDIEMWGLLGDG